MAKTTTSLISEELADWFHSNPPVRVPWLSAQTRWQVIQAELLLGRASADIIARAWRSLKSIATPSETIVNEGFILMLARHWDREIRADQLMECARWFENNLASLSTEASAQELMTAPWVTSAIADIACRIVPGDTEDPVLAGYGVLRIAARFQGEIVDRQNRFSDGRLALAWMIGAGECSHEAHLALIELANGVCGPRDATVRRVSVGAVVRGSGDT